MARSKHDAFFCRSLEHPAVTKDFLKQYIPPHLKQQVIWESLYRIDRSNTDLELKKRHRDILYRASMLQGEDVILGIEHQSKEDPIMQIRYLRYDMDVLEACVKAGYDKWPLIINLLLYNGQKAPSSHLSEPIGYYRYTIDGKEHIHLFYYLINLMQISDEELLTHGLCAPMEILLKHSFDGGFKLNLSAYQGVFHACVKVVGEDYIHSMLKYADSLANFKIGRKMHKFVEEVFPDKPKIIMTYGQMLKREAKREGKREGIREGSIAIAKNMINKGYDIKSIQEITELPKETIEKLKAE
ncbi:MAG: hypothetical protein BGO68_01430 [Candidatus Amoebophilus sp. 36-38]|nr:MAG: hypothetical protein BGO68_01430 [Candidatus Amoebophilus sp. 36-38]